MFKLITPLFLLAVLSSGQTILAQLAPFTAMKSFELGFEMNYGTERSPKVLFDDIILSVPWVHVPVKSGFGIYGEVPFIWASRSQLVRNFGLGKAEVRLINPMIALTYNSPSKRWNFGTGVRFPWGKDDKLAPLAAFFLLNSTPELADDVTTFQIWVNKRGAKPILNAIYLDVHAGVKSFMDEGIFAEVVSTFRPTVTYKHNLFSIDAYYDNYWSFTGTDNAYTGNDQFIHRLSLGATLEGYQARPYVRWIRNLGDILDEIVRDVFTLGVLVRI